MKFFSWLGTIIFLIVILSAITAPGDKKFENFINEQKGGDTMSCKPIIGKSQPVKIFVRIFSFNDVSYCELDQTPVRLLPMKMGKRNADTSKTAGIQFSIPRVIRSETYLGLFGRFWKI